MSQKEVHSHRYQGFLPFLDSHSKHGWSDGGPSPTEPLRCLLFPHSGVLWPSWLSTSCPDVWRQLHSRSCGTLQLHGQADSGGKCHPHVWTGWALDRLPPPLLRYGVWCAGGCRGTGWWERNPRAGGHCILGACSSSFTGRHL